MCILLITEEPSMALESYVKSPLEPHRSAEHFELDLKCYVGAEDGSALTIKGG